MPLYFAYGSNMDVTAMQQRCPRSRPLSRATLPRHRFIIMAEGYASVQRDGTRSVHGVLWDVALGDVRALDAYECIGNGLYTKISQPVLREAGASVRALVYVGRGKGGGRPLDGYMEAVIGAAKSWQLPDAYLRELSTLAPGMGQNLGQGASQGFTQSTGAPKVRPRFATPLDRR